MTDPVAAHWLMDPTCEEPVGGAPPRKQLHRIVVGPSSLHRPLYRGKQQRSAGLIESPALGLGYNRRELQTGEGANADRTGTSMSSPSSGSQPS